MKQGAKGDEAKNLSWLMDFCFVRLMVTNEITIDWKGSYILNGNIIKKISSGGDSIEARKKSQDEVIFKVQCRPVLFCNDLPSIEPKDALSTLTKFESPCQFVKDAELKKDNELNPLAIFKETDDQIKTKCKTDIFIRRGQRLRFGQQSKGSGGVSLHEKPELTIPISSMGSGVCTHSG